MSKEVVASGGVIELAAVVTLDTADIGFKLGASMGKEVGEDGEDIRLETKGESPHIVRKIIENNEVVFVAGNTQKWGSPQITMY